MQLVVLGEVVSGRAPWAILAGLLLVRLDHSGFVIAMVAGWAPVEAGRVARRLAGAVLLAVEARRRCGGVGAPAVLAYKRPLVLELMEEREDALHVRPRLLLVICLAPGNFFDPPLEAVRVNWLLAVLGRG